MAHCDSQEVLIVGGVGCKYSLSKVAFQFQFLDTELHDCRVAGSF